MLTDRASYSHYIHCYAPDQHRTGPNFTCPYCNYSGEAVYRCTRCAHAALAAHCEPFESAFPMPDNETYPADSEY